MQIPRPRPEILAGSKGGPRNLYSERVPSQPVLGDPDAGDTQRGQAPDWPQGFYPSEHSRPAAGSWAPLPEVLIRAGAP